MFRLVTSAYLFRFRFLTRVYWYSQLLNPRLLKTLPDNVVVIGLVLHVLLWILCAINPQALLGNVIFDSLASFTMAQASFHIPFKSARWLLPDSDRQRVKIRVFARSQLKRRFKTNTFR